MMKIAIIFMALVFATCKGNERCDRLYSALIKLRDAAVRDPTIDTSASSLPSKVDRALGIDIEYVPLLLGVDIDDDEGWRTLACQVAASQDISDLSEALGMPWYRVVEYISGDLMQRFYARWRNSLVNYRSTLFNLATWTQRSGFPDTWPINPVTNTAAVMRNAQQIHLLHYVAIGAHPMAEFPRWRDVTRGVNTANNLRSYLLSIGTADLLSYPDLLEEKVGESRQMLTRSTADAKVATLQAGLEFVEVLIDLGTIAIVDDYAVYDKMRNVIRDEPEIIL